MTTIPQLKEWISAPRETEHLEFKEARNLYDRDNLMKYCVAIANEGGGKLILGVSDSPPRQIVGSAAFPNTGDIAFQILTKLRFRVDVEELQHPEGRVLVFHIPPRPLGTAYTYEGAYLMRSGESLVAMSEDRLRQIFNEGQPDWLSEFAKTGVHADEVIQLLDTQAYFDLLKLPYPTNRDGVLERLKGEELITPENGSWSITRLAAILLAKNLDQFPLEVSRKAVRVVVYEGAGKLKTRLDQTGKKGYAVGFESLLNFVVGLAPANAVVEQAIRLEVKMFPQQALRELIANALIHQDFNVSGTSVMIEMYQDRVEISNPGTPPIDPQRFIDEYRSRNERLADLMRRMGICEEKGSGVDKVVSAAEDFQLPAPDFRVATLRTTAVLFAHKDFADMSKTDRIRACYQHCVLMYVTNQRMTNKSLRDRFNLPENKVASVSQVISSTQDAGFVKLDDSETESKRYARYLPYWA
ncbi:MAG TPA: ATP-binding protein [Holophagaceae bacterium]|nr:ATP-binding protein [Holophagaceae bacterium]